MGGDGVCGHTRDVAIKVVVAEVARIGCGRVGVNLRCEDAPPTERRKAKTETAELYLIARDGRGNETLRLGSASQPFEVTQVYEEPLPWYGEWWVWTVAGVVVATGATAGYLLTRPPPDTVPTDLNCIGCIR